MEQKLFMLFKNDVNADILAMTTAVLDDVLTPDTKKEPTMAVFVTANKVLHGISKRWCSDEHPITMLTEKEFYTMAYVLHQVTNILLDDDVSVDMDPIDFFKNAEKFFDCFKEEIGGVDDDEMFVKSGLMESTFIMK